MKYNDMKIRYAILPALLLFAACAGESDKPAPQGGPADVVLRVSALNGGATRAAIDKWNKTTISLAYHMGSTTYYAKNVNVVVKGENDQIVHMGMEYSSDASEDFFVRGYHPAAAPDAAGIVRYDISNGDVDLMCSNELSGNKNNPIIDEGKNLVFKHKLTRLTVRMSNAENQEYLEKIAAVIVTGNEVAHSYLPTQAELDLQTGLTGEVEFRGLGIIRAGYTSAGLIMPPHNAPVDIDAMIAPDRPIKLYVLTTDDSMIEISLAGTTLDFLETDGGQEGEQYVIRLMFHSVAPLGDASGIVTWETIRNNPGDWW